MTKLWQEPGVTATSETTAPIEGDENGDGRLSEFEKQILAQNALRDFEMPDGSILTLNPQDPAPAEVKDVLAEQAQPVGDLYKANTDFSPESIGSLNDQMRAMAESQAKAIGRPVVIVFSSPNGAGGTQWIAAPSEQKSTGILADLNRDAMLAKVDSWAMPRGYEVIVLR